MDYYFFIISSIDIFALGIVLFMAKFSETLSKRQKRGFIAAFALILFISIMEIITVVVDGVPLEYRFVNYLSNYLGFGLSPLIPICIAISIDKEQNVKICILCELVYLILLTCSIPLGLVFYVDANNEYARGPYFGVYIFAYLCAIFYLTKTTLALSKKFQNQSKVLVVPIVVFLIAGTTIQVLLPHVRLTWLCVTMLTILYYVYCSEMWQQLDGLTGLLNQNTYVNKTASIKNSCLLLIFDVDDFKKVNDCYGHLAGDACLKEVAACIKLAYSPYGYCYRIGGDEFCVLLNDISKEQDCYLAFIDVLKKKRKEKPYLPFVSVGAAYFPENGNIAAVKEIADQNMYQYKKEHKCENGFAANE